MRTDQAHRASGKLFLQFLGQESGARHVDRARIRILPVDDQADEPGAGVDDAFDRIAGGEAFSPAIQDADAEAFGAAALGQEQGPGGSLDCREILAQALIHLERRIGADE